MQLDITNLQLWACQYKREKPDTSTASYCKDGSIGKLVKQASNAVPWDRLYKKGWRAVPVTVAQVNRIKRLAAAQQKEVPSQQNATA